MFLFNKKIPRVAVGLLSNIDHIWFQNVVNMNKKVERKL